MQSHQTATTPVYPSSESNQKTGIFNKIIQVLREEIGDLQPRYLLARLLLAPLPDYSFTRVRVHVLRLAGFKGISSKATMWGLPIITGPDNIYARLKVGDVSRFNIGCLLNLGADITIGDNVAFGHNVTILTETHEIGPPSSRSGPLIAKPVKIGHGCWIGANATILPGVTIGDGVIIAANAVVTKDIPSNTIAAGMPARVARKLPEE